jgi:hypothetical protein
MASNRDTIALMKDRRPTGWGILRGDVCTLRLAGTVLPFFNRLALSSSVTGDGRSLSRRSKYDMRFCIFGDVGILDPGEAEVLRCSVSPVDIGGDSLLPRSTLDKSSLIAAFAVSSGDHMFDNMFDDVLAESDFPLVADTTPALGCVEMLNDLGLLDSGGGRTLPVVM